MSMFVVVFVSVSVGMFMVAVHNWPSFGFGINSGRDS